MANYRQEWMSVEANEGAMMNNALVFSTTRVINGNRALVGGYCDRLKGAVFTYLSAIMSGKKFFIDWDGYAPITDWFLPNEVDWRIDLSVVDMLRDQGNVIDLVDKRFTDEVKEKLLMSNDGWRSVFGKWDSALVHTNLYPIWLFQKTRASIPEKLPSKLGQAATFAWAYHKLFRYNPTGAHEARYERFRSFKASCDCLVGVQFRTGGQGLWRDPQMDDVENSEIIAGKAIALCRDGLGAESDSKVGFYVTSDSEQARQRIATKLESEGQVFFYDERPIHLDRSEEEMVRTGAGQVALEHHVLSQCDGIVSGKGGFGQVASWIGGVPLLRYS